MSKTTTTRTMLRSTFDLPKKWRRSWRLAWRMPMLPLLPRRWAILLAQRKPKGL